MPPTTKKKVTKKATTKTKVKPTTRVKKVLVAPTNDINHTKEELFIPKKQFINIYDKDPKIESKSRLTWLIVGAIMLAVISFWFWSLKISTNKTASNSNDLNIITSEIDNIIKEFKGVVGDSEQIINDSDNQLYRDQEIERIKNDVLAQIQINSDSANWPTHTSNLLGLSLKYPTNWIKQEKKESLILSSYDLNTTTPKLFAKITITRITNNQEPVSALVDNISSYNKSSDEIFIDLIPAEKYISTGLDTNILSYILIINNPKYIYKLEIYTTNQSIFDASINKILSTIDLL